MNAIEGPTGDRMDASEIFAKVTRTAPAPVQSYHKSTIDPGGRLTAGKGKEIQSSW